MSGKANSRKTFGKKIKDQSDEVSQLYSLHGKGTIMASTKSAVSGTINNTEVSGQFTTLATADLNMRTYDILDLDRLKFATSEGAGDALTSTDYGIEAIYTGTTAYGLQIRIPEASSDVFKLYRGTQEEIGVSMAGIVLTDSVTIASGNARKAKLVLAQYDSSVTPATPSSSTRTLFVDGTNSDNLSVKKPDGAVIDLEAGATGANQQLSNLSGTIAINDDLIPDNNNQRDLGSSAKIWKDAWTETLWTEFVAGKSTVGASNNVLLSVGHIDPFSDETYDLGASTKQWHNIWGKTVQGVSYVDFETTNTRIIDSSGTLQLESNSGLTFMVGGNSEFQINSSGLYLSTHSTPSSLANGMIWNDGTDVHVRTGGATKNMSDIGSGGGGSGANTSLSNLSSVIVNANINMNDKDITNIDTLDVDGLCNLNSTVNLGNSASDNIYLKGELNVQNNYTSSSINFYSLYSEGYIEIEVGGNTKRLYYFDG